MRKEDKESIKGKHSKGLVVCIIILWIIFPALMLGTWVAFSLCEKGRQSQKLMDEDQFDDDIEVIKERNRDAGQNIEKDNYHVDDYNDENTQARELLDIIGKGFFIKYYYALRDLSEQEVIERITKYGIAGVKAARVSVAKKIFELGLEENALIMCANSKNWAVAEKAREILGEKSNTATDDYESDNTQVNELLDIIGKGSFVKYYYEFRDLPEQKMAERITEPGSADVKAARVAAAKKIFVLESEEDALLICANSENWAIAGKARQLLKELN
jgi:hypothetical protein